MRMKIMVLLMILLALSGCLEQQVENGDMVEVNYIGMLENGEIFDTNYASVALNISIPKSEDFQIRVNYKPLAFKVGGGGMIEGFDKAIIGMKIGEIKTFTVSPDEGFGKYDPALIMFIPRIQNIPRTHVENRTIEVQAAQFEGIFGEKAVLNKSLKIPGTNANATIINITSTTIFLEHDSKVDDIFEVEGAPWNETVVSLNQTKITFSINLLPNQTIQYQGIAWNSTAIEVGADTITLWHNSIPRTRMQTMYGPAYVSFDETTINLDYNHPLAGRTLKFQVELVNLTKSKK